MKIPVSTASFRSHGTYRTVRTPGLIQMDPLECGPVALAIVLAHFGRWVSIEELRTACGVSRNGSRANHLLQVARAYGLDAQAFKVEPRALRQLKPPLVLHWNFTHFVVLEGFGRRGRARINDPGMGHREVCAAELDESMTGVVLALRPGPQFERKGRPPRLWKALRSRLEQAHGAVLFAVSISLLLLFVNLLTPAFPRLFVDRVMLWRADAWVAPLLAAMAGTLLVMTLLNWLQRSFLLRFETRLAVQGAGRFFWHLLRLPIEFFHQRFPGDVASRVAINDRLAQLLAGDLAVSGLHVLVLLGFAAVMLQYDVMLTGFSLLLVAVNLLVLCWVSRRRADANTRLLREESRLNGIALWGLEMIESLKATSSEDDLFARWAGQQAKVINIRHDLELANQPLEMLPPLLSALNAALILGVGGLRVIEGQFSLGSLVSFQILAVTLTGPVNRLVSLARRLQIAEGEVGLLDDVFRSRPLPLDAGPSEPSPASRCQSRGLGAVELHDVSFGYSPLDPPLIHGVSLSLQPGVHLAIVGKTGSGKSTLTRLLLGLHEPWQGRVLFDGVPRAEVPRRLWADSIAAVDQDIVVFEGTVRDNLQLFQSTVPEARLLAACRDACILDDIQARTGGLDAWVSEGGVNWSGGQLQRLEIARALAGDPSLLVLDEATSALDAETESQIISNLRRRGCACLIVAHRLSTIRDADEIIVLDDGRIVERGSHQALMRHQGLYSQLVVSE